MYIHLIGVGGIAMGTLACMLKEQGHRVTGSDEGIYPPMSEILREHKIETFSPYNASNLRSPDLVVIGNALSRGNPEVETVLDGRLNYMSMAGALFEFFLRHREVICVSGTHGKSTTSALISHILVTAGQDPSFFVGGRLRNYDSSYRIGKGNYFVIEGDEYDSAFFEKVPKFVFYRPYHAVLTSLEYDHADIYGSLEEIELWFRRLVNIVPGRGVIAACSRYANIIDIVSPSRSRVVTFDTANAMYTAGIKGEEGDTTSLILETPSGKLDLESGIHGEFNILNIAGACALLLELGIPRESVAEGVATFHGVSRRQEVIYSGEGVTVYEDFAHHPTAISGVLESMRKRYPNDVLWALYEPRSATSRRNVFQDILGASFARADHVLLKTPFRPEAIPEDRRLDIDRVAGDIAANGGTAHVFTDTGDMVKHLAGSMDRACGNVVIVMSNGGFDGIYDLLPGVLGGEGRIVR